VGPNACMDFGSAHMLGVHGVGRVGNTGANTLQVLSWSIALFHHRVFR
jgi:hypothetical protein